MSSVSSTTSGSYYYAMQKRMFDKLDTDQNGSLSEKEYHAGKSKNAGNKEQTAAVYEALDTDKSGTVTLDEYAAGAQVTPGGGLLGQLSSGALDVLMQLKPQDGGAASGNGDTSGSGMIFDTLDANKDGVVSEQEFLAAHPGTVSDAEAKKLFETIDRDRDGNIDNDQFRAVADATTPPRLMGTAYFGSSAQSGGGTSSGGLASLFGGTAGGVDSAYRLYSLLEGESEGGMT